MPDTGEDVSGINISSFIVSNTSHDDASYLITSKSGAVIHANDNWRRFTPKHHKIISNKIASFNKNDILLFCQTNSASGYPLNYEIFDKKQKINILKSKVASMVKESLLKAESLNLDRIFSYAGYASAYVKEEDYHLKGLFPTASYLNNLLVESGISSRIKIESLYPGDYINLPGGNITKAFVTDYKDINIKEKTNLFYENYRTMDRCLSFLQSTNNVVLNEKMD